MNVNTDALLTLTGAGAGTVNSPDLANLDSRGGSFLVNLTGVTSASITITIYGKDATSGQYYVLLASPAMTVSGNTLLQIAPGLTNSSNSANALLPKTFRISATITGASASVTGTVGASLGG